jgi:hypothetical protein
VSTNMPSSEGFHTEIIPQKNLSIFTCLDHTFRKMNSVKRERDLRPPFWPSQWNNLDLPNLAITEHIKGAFCDVLHRVGSTPTGYYIIVYGPLVLTTPSGSPITIDHLNVINFYLYICVKIHNIEGSGIN